jgi:hypothetical protein
MLASLRPGRCLPAWPGFGGSRPAPAAHALADLVHRRDLAQASEALNRWGPNDRLALIRRPTAKDTMPVGVTKWKRLHNALASPTAMSFAVVPGLSPHTDQPHSRRTT